MMYSCDRWLKCLGLTPRGCIAVILALGWGCEEPAQHDSTSKPHAAAKDDGELEVELEPTPPATTALQQERATLVQWSGCVRNTSARIEQAWARYVVDIDPHTGTPRSRKLAPFVHVVNTSTSGCRMLRNLAAAPDTAPANTTGLDEAGASYLVAVEEFAELSSTLARYLNAEAYKADQWADGKELAPKLQRAYAAWTLEHSRLAPLLQTQRTLIDTQRLKELEQLEAPTLQLNLLRAQLAVRGLGTCLTPSDHSAAVTPACTQALIDYSAAHSELDTLCQSSLQVCFGVFWLNVFRDQALQLEGEVRQFAHPPTVRKQPRARTRAAKAKAKAQQADAHQRLRKVRAATLDAGDKVHFGFP